MSESTYREIDHALSEYEQAVGMQESAPTDATTNGLIRSRTGVTGDNGEAARAEGELLTKPLIEDAELTGNELQNDGKVEVIPAQSTGNHDRTVKSQNEEREPKLGRQVLRAPEATDHDKRGDSSQVDQEVRNAAADLVHDGDPRQIVAMEFRRVIERHGHDTDSADRKIFDLVLSGEDVPPAIRMRKVMASADGRHIAMGGDPPASEASRFADVPGVMVARSGGVNVDRLARYSGQTYEQILGSMGSEPDTDTLAMLANALKVCEVGESRRRIDLPTEEERAEYNRIRAVRVRLINEAASEAAGSQCDAPAKAGPYHGDFKDILTSVDQQLARINSATGLSLTSESLVPQSYQSREAKRQNNALSTFRDGHRALAEIIWARRRLIRDLVDDKIDMSDQRIPEGLLVEPRYLRMGSDHQACFNACFRMVCGDITGQTLSEHEVSDAIEKVHGISLVADGEYMKILESDAVGEISGYSVRSVEFFGADLDYVTRLASIVKNKRPDAKVYSVVSLATELEGNFDIWHTNVLLSADNDYVYCHDPSSANRGAPNRPIKKEAFVRRWATAYNRGHLVFAVPKNKGVKVAA